MTDTTKKELDKVEQIQLTQNQIIKRVQYLIDTNNGDVGRLYHILEFLKLNKELYHSDKKYLEDKISTQFIIVNEEKPKENQILSKIQTLINSGQGDPGRLQHIFDIMSRNKSLYHSDQVYLEQQLESINQITKESKRYFEKTIADIVEKKSEPRIVISKETFYQPTHSTKLRGVMPKDWSPPDNNLYELTGIYEKIKNEEELLNENKKAYDEINLQRSKLSQIILNRKEYEKQVSLEKSLLDSQIKEEHLKIQAQTRLSEQILLQKEELEKVKTERSELMKKIDDEKDIVSKDLELQKKQLVQTRLEQEEIEKQINQERASLSKMLEEQKSNLLNQAQITHDIKEKQADLERTKKEYDEIISQVNNEKTKLAESEKLKKLIKSQENDLIKTKDKRLKIDDIIAKEKENIAKKTKEEQEKLKVQSELAKQLADEKKALDEIKQKRKQIETEIKLKKQDSKEEQQIIRKQIAEINKQLRSSITESSKSKTRKLTKTT